MPGSLAHKPILDWYDANARTLPWRPTSPWGVLVSEVMLQQTPVSRVLPAFEAWMARWPTAGALAIDQPGEAVRMWGRLGYPRRALRLHQAATIIDRDHAGEVPSSYQLLRSLPGVGDYTAAAVLSFAYGERALVLDTNVRRVLGRLYGGAAQPAPAVSAAERQMAEAVLPALAVTAARWSVAVMELGALVCSARAPACERCPVVEQCTWRQAGSPPDAGPARRGQRYAGTDRQCRGRILAVLREADGPVPCAEVEAVWSDGPQRQRALASLLDDGLVVSAGEGAFALP
jgi:A/G-specific adenine glycosylase